MRTLVLIVARWPRRTTHGAVMQMQQTRRASSTARRVQVLQMQQTPIRSNTLTALAATKLGDP